MCEFILFLGDNMWLKKGNKFVPKILLNEVKKRYRIEKNAKAKIRLLVFIKRKESKSLTTIVQETNQSKTNISRWLKKIEDNGFDGIYDLKQPGKPPRLTEKQKEKLKKILSESPIKHEIPFTMWSSSLVQFIVDKLFNVLYKIRKIEYLVKELGFTFQKPRPRHRKANKKAQEEFKKNFVKKYKNTLNWDSRSLVLTKHTSS
jgi:transposase